MRWLASSTTVEIDRPIAEVWAFIADLENMPQWVNGVTEPAHTSTGPFGEGSTFTSLYTYACRTHSVSYAVTAFEPPRVEATEGPFPFRGRMTLTLAGGWWRMRLMRGPTAR